jgi:hypothetical protein
MKVVGGAAHLELAAGLHVVVDGLCARRVLHAGGEGLWVGADLAGPGREVGVVERGAAGEEVVVHRPEQLLARGADGGASGGGRLGVKGQREVAKHDAEVARVARLEAGEDRVEAGAVGALDVAEQHHRQERVVQVAAGGGVGGDGHLVARRGLVVAVALVGGGGGGEEPGEGQDGEELSGHGATSARHT